MVVEDIRQTLGKTQIQIPPIGIGAWAWGDNMFWGYGRGYAEKDVQEAIDLAFEAGVNFFDTAEVYGQGRSEKLLGKYLQEREAVVATKFFPFPWRLRKKSLRRALEGSLRRLGLKQVDLYQIHQPFPPVSVETWADGLADLVESGLVRAVGVSNYNEEQMRRAHTTLAQRGIPLASNQLEYSLIQRKVELNGLIQACQELGVTVIAYSPLGQGVLTGKYGPEKPLPGFRGRVYNRDFLGRSQPLVKLMREIGQAHGGKTAAQIAINWCICKETVPIPGAKNAKQANENNGALGWQLSPAEVAALDEASLNAQQ